MQIWQAIILGAVQGFAEFLPVSSSGHLILIQRWLGINAESGGLFFDVMLHVGTLIPLFMVFFSEIMELFRRPAPVTIQNADGSTTQKRPLFSKKLIYLVIATIPVGVIGLFLSDYVEGVFYKGDNLAACLLAGTFVLTAIELLVSEIVSKKSKRQLPLNHKNTLFMGFMQGVAALPGLSRSGTVISAGCFAGVKREENANFSFLLSIPVILGAALVECVKLIKDGIVIDAVPLIFGMLTAALTGYIAINTMLKVVKKANYKWFSLYLILIATASVVTKLVFNI